METQNNHDLDIKTNNADLNNDPKTNINLINLSSLSSVELIELLDDENDKFPPDHNEFLDYIDDMI